MFCSGLTRAFLVVLAIGWGWSFPASAIDNNAEKSADKQAKLTQKVQALEISNPDSVILFKSLRTLIYDLVNIPEQSKRVIALPYILRGVTLLKKNVGYDANPEKYRQDLFFIRWMLLATGVEQPQEMEWLLLREVEVIENTIGLYHIQKSKGESDEGYNPALKVLIQLEDFYYEQSRPTDANRVHERILAIQEKIPCFIREGAAHRLFRDAEAYEAKERLVEAELLIRKGLAIDEKVLCPAHRKLGENFVMLAKNLARQKKHNEAEQAYKQAITTYENDRHSLSLIKLLYVLLDYAELYSRQNRYAEAEHIHKRALRVDEEETGDPESIRRHKILISLATLYEKQGKYAKALPLLEFALGISEKHGFWVIESLDRLLKNHLKQAKFVEAERFAKRILELTEEKYGLDHPDVATALANLAYIYDRQARYNDSLQFYRRASVIARKRIGDIEFDLSEEIKRSAGQLKRHLHALEKVEATFRPSAVMESFELAQLQGMTGTSQAVAAMSARFAAGQEEMARIVRQRQEVAQYINSADSHLKQMLGSPTSERNENEEREIRSRSSTLRMELAKLDDRIARDFPAFAEITRPQPMTIKETQDLLYGDEAIITYVIWKDRSWAWVVRKKGAFWIPLDAPGTVLEKWVEMSRKSTNLNDGRISPAAVETLYFLYRDLFNPLEKHLAGVKLIHLVTDGPLQGLPFAMLVSSPPTPWRSSQQYDYIKVEWLIKRFAFSVLPSVTSLRALRRYSQHQNPAAQAFTGFGDPLLNDTAGTTRGRLNTAGLFSLRGGLADTKILKDLPRLPETADELRYIAQAFNSNEQDIYLAERATEIQVKRASLDQYRVVAFSTHGIMAGEISVPEPGLVLTPPVQATADDDGYLAASEVAKLNLNADWVILSACNTAAPDGKPEAEGLSGLAKAFFYAGSKALLVSHWGVASAATVRLITRTVESQQKNPRLPRAEALRQSMLNLMHDKLHKEYAHPAFWAPFELVGEGRY